MGDWMGDETLGNRNANRMVVWLRVLLYRPRGNLVANWDVGRIRAMFRVNTFIDEV